MKEVSMSLLQLHNFLQISDIQLEPALQQVNNQDINKLQSQIAQFKSEFQKVTKNIPLPMQSHQFDHIQQSNCIPLPNFEKCQANPTNPENSSELLNKFKTFPSNFINEAEHLVNYIETNMDSFQSIVAANQTNIDIKAQLLQMQKNIDKITVQIKMFNNDI
ncbi:Hypothetical_protein [Hexamita inflata]|uniref:Hypothetical_protein n=1 Tax=Hexamita inflata TaxID=28002 RepID=A0AA86PKU5_9EUKA|nr:Hypothetical protein HINF_LOCUS29480 [Hexamita inflata]